MLFLSSCGQHNKGKYNKYSFHPIIPINKHSITDKKKSGHSSAMPTREVFFLFLVQINCFNDFF